MNKKSRKPFPIGTPIRVVGEISGKKSVLYTGIERRGLVKDRRKDPDKNLMGLRLSHYRSLREKDIGQTIPKKIFERIEQARKTGIWWGTSSLRIGKYHLQPSFDKSGNLVDISIHDLKSSKRMIIVFPPDPTQERFSDYKISTNRRSIREYNAEDLLWGRRYHPNVKIMRRRPKR